MELLVQELLIPAEKIILGEKFFFHPVAADAVLENLIGSPPSDASDESIRNSDSTPEKKELEREDGSTEGTAGEKL